MKRLFVNAFLSGLVSGVATYQSMPLDTPVTMITLGLPVLVGVGLNLAGDRKSVV